MRSIIRCLREYDINYYLNERPSEFMVAVVVGAALIAALAYIVLRLYSGWFLALPLVLFYQVRASDALRASRDLIAGNRRRVLVWLIVWLAFVVLSNMLATAVIGGLGRLLIPSGVGSIVVLATRVGLLVLLLAASQPDRQSVCNNRACECNFSRLPRVQPQC